MPYERWRGLSEQTRAEIAEGARRQGQDVAVALSVAERNGQLQHWVRLGLIRDDRFSYYDPKGSNKQLTVRSIKCKGTVRTVPNGVLDIKVLDELRDIIEWAEWHENGPRFANNHRPGIGPHGAVL